MRFFASAILCVVMATIVSGQAGQKPKKFLTGPLVIEDQGSFFIGGVQKVIEMNTCHGLMVSEPERLAEILVERCRARQ